MENENIHPVIIDGEDRGRLRVSAMGAMTEFAAECRDAKRVIRLSVYGDGGKEGYLGVMLPDGHGLMHIKKRLSRASTALFPAHIEYAGESSAEGAVSAQNPGGAGRGGQRAEEASGRGGAEESAGTEQDLLWFSTPEGFLVCFDGRHQLVAVPLGEKPMPAGRMGELREIEGKKYIVYTTKNGTIT